MASSSSVYGSTGSSVVMFSSCKEIDSFTLIPSPEQTQNSLLFIQTTDILGE